MMPKLPAALATLFLVAAPASAFDQAALDQLNARGECTGCNLAKADLRSADLQAAILDGADLSGADLEDANLTAASLAGANLSGANLEGAELSAADLSGANLEGASLVGAEVLGATFTNAKLKGADIRGTDIAAAIDADITEAAGQAPAVTPQKGAGQGLQNLLTGTLLLTAFDYCPSGSLAADGRALTINDNQALYALYGATYGADGTSFRLPDLRQTVPVKGLLYCVVVGGTWPSHP